MSRHDTHVSGVTTSTYTINRPNNKSISFEGIDKPTKELALKHFIGITLHLHQSKSFRIRYKFGCFIHFANSSNGMNPTQNFGTWNPETFCKDFE